MYYDFGKGFVIEEHSICDSCKSCVDFLSCADIDITNILRHSDCGYVENPCFFKFNKNGLCSRYGGCYCCRYDCFRQK